MCVRWWRGVCEVVEGVWVLVKGCMDVHVRWWRVEWVSA